LKNITESNERGINEEKMKINNKKKIIFGIVFFALIILIIGIIIILSNKSPKSVCERIENGYCISEYLKFQELVAIENNESGNPIAIDENELWNFSEKPISDYFVLKNPDNTSEGFLCADKDTPYDIEIIYYFVKGCDDLSNIRENCPYWRLAIICDSFYIIEDNNLIEGSYGLYGPYEL